MGREPVQEAPGATPGVPWPLLPPLLLSRLGAPQQESGNGRCQVLVGLRCCDSTQTGRLTHQILFLFCLELDVPDKALTGPRPLLGLPTVVSPCAHVVPRTRIPSIAPF